jgi:Fe-Mn family superoxide dismutase
MRPGGAAPDVELERLLTKEFGSLQKLKEAFGKAATGHFGSGWAWLVQVNSGELAVLSTHDADNPLRTGQTPLLTCDVWEHAYYIDYRNKRQDYVEAWWKLADWSFVKQNLAVGASAE